MALSLRQGREEQQSDPLLVERAQKGDRAAFACLYERWASSLFRFLLVKLGSRESAEDILQEVFLELLRREEKTSIDNVKSYLFQSCRNRSLNFIKRQRQWMQSVEHASELGLLKTEHLNAEASFTAEEAGEINRLLGELPEEQREAVVLKIYGDMTFEELAKLTDTNPKTAQYRYAAGLKRLQEKYRVERK